MSGFKNESEYGKAGVTQSAPDPLQQYRTRFVVPTNGQVDCYALMMWDNDDGWVIPPLVKKLPGFDADDNGGCWKQYGLHGCLDIDLAQKAYDEVVVAYPEEQWQLMHLMVVQQSTMIKCNTQAVIEMPEAYKDQQPGAEA